MTGQSGAWPIDPFKDIADYDTGKTPARASGEYWTKGPDDIPWVTISDLPAYGTVRATKERISATAHDRVFRGKLVAAGTLLMSFKLTIGRVATLAIPAVHNEAIISIHPRPGIDQRFLGYYLSQVDYSQLQDRQIKGNTLNKSKIDRIPVPVPAEHVQKKIADLLDAARASIQCDRAALAATKTLKQALGHKLLAAQEVGTNWISERIGDSHIVSSGGTPSRAVPEYWTGGTIAWVKTTEVDYTVITETSERITASGLANSAAKILPTGTVLLAMYGQGVTRGKVAVLGIDAASNQACAAIQPANDAVDSRYLYQYLTLQYGELRHMAHGGQQQNLNLDIVRDFPLTYPERRDEQARIVDVLDALDDKIRIHEARLPLLEALFKALLTGLMCQELDVDGIETEPVAVALAKECAA